MAIKKKLPKDLNQRAKSILDLITGEDDKPTISEADLIKAAASAMGRKGGLIGGKVRAEKLSPERRSEIAKKAAAARWKDKDKEKKS